MFHKTEGSSMKRLITTLFILTVFTVGQEPALKEPAEATQGENKSPNEPKKKTMEEALKNTKKFLA